MFLLLDKDSDGSRSQRADHILEMGRETLNAETFKMTWLALCRSHEGNFQVNYTFNSTHPSKQFLTQ